MRADDKSLIGALRRAGFALVPLALAFPVQAEELTELATTLAEPIQLAQFGGTTKRTSPVRPAFTPGGSGGGSSSGGSGGSGGGTPLRQEAELPAGTYAMRYSYGYPTGSAAGAGWVMTSATRPDGERVEYRYDTDGTLIGVDSVRGDARQTIVADIQRNVHNDITAVRLGNGVQTAYAYDDNRSWRLASKRVTRGADALLDLRFGWDDNGNLKTLTNQRPDRAWASWTYDYDSLDQLTLATGAGGAAAMAYEYSGTGNLTRKSAMVPVNGQWQLASLEQRYGEANASPYAVTRSGNDTFAYDPNGNLIRTSVNGGLTIEWDANNMPMRTRRGDRILTEKWFVGESMWRRVENDLANETSTTTLYAFPEVQIENGRFRHRYADWAERDPADGRLRFYHRDQLGSSSVVTDESGQVVYEALHQPFGEDWQQPVRAYDPLKKFSDKEKEKSTGLYDFGARLYIAQVGRWASADSIEAGVLADPLNRYHYASNNPASRLDPDGHCDQKVDGKPCPPAKPAFKHPLDTEASQLSTKSKTIKEPIDSFKTVAESTAKYAKTPGMKTLMTNVKDGAKAAGDGLKFTGAVEVATGNAPFKTKVSYMGGVFGGEVGGAASAGLVAEVTAANPLAGAALAIGIGALSTYAGQKVTEKGFEWTARAKAAAQRAAAKAEEATAPLWDSINRSIRSLYQ